MLKPFLLKCFACFFYLTLPVFSVIAQEQNGQPNLDALLSELKSAPEDTTKVSMLVNISQMHWSFNPPEGIQYAQQALALSEKLNWKKGIAMCNGVLGMNHVIISDYPTGIFYLEKSLKISTEMGDVSGMSRANGAIGNVYYHQSRFPEAQEYYLASLKLSEQMGNKTEQAASLANIGTINLGLGKYDEALVYFEKAKKLNEETENKIYLSSNLNNMASIYVQMHNQQKAIDCYHEALVIAQEIDAKDLIATSYINLGSIKEQQQNPEEALDFAAKALEISIMINSDFDKASCYRLMASTYTNSVLKNNQEFLDKHFQGNRVTCLKAAEQLADSSVVLFNELGSIAEVKESYKVLSETQAALGNDKGALVSYQKYAAAKDSIFNMEKDKKLTQSAMQYEFDKKQATEQAEQDKRDIRQKNIRNSIALTLGGALIFLVVVFRQRNKIAKEKHRSEELLLNILPESVAEELKSKGSAEAKLIDEVTVLFTDFKGFTAMSEKVSPKELVADLHDCFSAFDSIIEKYGLEKIKTIGDAYMAAGGLPTPNQTHASDAVKAALEMREFITSGKAKKIASGLPYFEIRIGLHTGPVVAGIVGVKKFQYDIWGDTVNTASRMESSGEVGKVNVSETTYALVRDQFACEHRGKISAKGKGEIDMYFVENRS